LIVRSIKFLMARLDVSYFGQKHALGESPKTPTKQFFQILLLWQMP